MSAADRVDEAIGLIAADSSLAAVLQALPDLVSIVDADGCVEFVSPASDTFLGLAPNLVTGQPACQFIAPEDRRNWAAWIAHARVAPDVPALVHHYRHRDGTDIVVESTVRALPGGSARLLVASRDLAARTAIDEQLDAVAQNWTEVFDVVREGVLVVDGACTVLCANRAAGILLGVHPQALPGSPLARYLEPVAGQPDFDLTTQFLRGGPVPASSDVPCTARRSDAPTPSLRMTATPMPRRTQRSPKRSVVLIESATVTGRNATTRGRALRALLSPREIEVLRLLADGHDVHDVSSMLGISIHTTRNYVKSVLHKLDVRNQLQAVVVALRAGLFELS